MAHVDSARSGSERLHALDAVRGFALLLGIAFHATLSFIPTSAPIWPVQDTHRSVVLSVVFFATHVFRMTTFFLIAGFFAHMSFHRRGALGFIGDRLKRIALPLVVGWPILFAAIVAVSLWAAIAANGGQLPKAPPPAWPALPNFPLTHLWFLYVLLEFYAAAMILRSPFALIDRGGRFRARIDRLVGRLTAGPFAAAVLAIPVALALAADPKWLMWFGAPAPDTSLVTNPEAAVGYGFAFGFGWLLHRQVDSLRGLERWWLLNLVLAVGFVTACLAMIGLTPELTPVADPTRHLLGAACYALATWTTTLAVIGLALRFLSGFSATRRYIADASYWLYLIHLPIVMALQVVVAPLDWPWPAKYAVILGVGLAVMFASYQLLVRRSFIGAVLNGRRAPPRSAPILSTHAAASTGWADTQEANR